MKNSIKIMALCAFFILGLGAHAQQTVADLNIYDTVDKMPRLKGAGNNISRYIRKQIDYNDSYKLKGVEGDVWVSFIVTAAGEVANVELEKGIDKELDAEVLRAVKATSGWKPGVVNKEKVHTQMRLPVRFVLSPAERNLSLQVKSLDEMGKRPLFVLDNKEVEGILRIEDYNVESIRVIKGEKARKLYGEKGADGVVVITSKRGTPPIY
ncbi:TonB family protein [Carboxylicivirga taeanensis]|uniref:energy transducer TonB n=1 Tax=Carboxylicivirga taeanensis TaxID=1416875 RepID=UPI003F6DCEE1